MLALLVIFVLSLDIIEYLIGLQAYRELAGDVIGSRRNYFRLRDSVLSTKLWVGFVTLLGICLILGLILTNTPVHAQGNAAGFEGNWCGRDPVEHYICFDVSTDEHLVLQSKLSFEGAERPLQCENTRTEDDNAKRFIIAQCDLWSVRGFLDNAALTHD